MNCSICNRKFASEELIKCIACKAGYHYKCLNITSAQFREEQVQLKRTFKCDSCANVTRRVRVTDVTPVRGASVGRTGAGAENQSFLDGVHMFSDEMVEKMSTVIMARISAFELSIRQEIKASVAILASENSKLRQELKDANEKCSSYENEIKRLQTEIVVSTQKAKGNDANSGPPIPAMVAEIITAPLSAATAESVPKYSVRVQATEQPSQAETSYAAAVGKAVQKEAVDVNKWIEVKNKKTQRKPVRLGGNNTIINLKAVERRKFLHVWRLEKSTTEVQLKEHIQQILGNGSEVFVEKLIPKTDRDYSSFKVGVTASNFLKLCDPDVWPLNVEYSEWIWFRSSTRPGKLQTE